MQLAHVEIGDTATDLTASLDDGCYLAQVRDQPETLGVLYASGMAAPDDDGDYFAARGHEFFTFVVGDIEPVTWCKSALPGQSVVLALAMVS